jgi:peptidoglycan/xylan/chitin deacetylase (PgdA/CDA1 family)
MIEPGLDWHSPMPHGFHRPDGVRAAACFTFDMDAESPILFEHPEAAGWLDVMSHQAYGPRTGVPRILRLLERRGVRATFFVPGYTAERWPSVVRAVRDAGHEIGHHGYLHEGARSSADEATEEAHLLHGLEALDQSRGFVRSAIERRCGSSATGCRHCWPGMALDTTAA